MIVEWLHYIAATSFVMATVYTATTSSAVLISNMQVLGNTYKRVLWFIHVLNTISPHFSAQYWLGKGGKEVEWGGGGYYWTLILLPNAYKIFEIW